MSSTALIRLEDGFIEHSLNPFASALFTTDKTFANGSFSIFHTTRPQLYFLNPILVAISLKHFLQRFRPYFSMKPRVFPHLRHCFMPFPNSRSFGLLNLR